MGPYGGLKGRGGGGVLMSEVTLDQTSRESDGRLARSATWAAGMKHMYTTDYESFEHTQARTLTSRRVLKVSTSGCTFSLCIRSSTCAFSQRECESESESVRERVCV